MDDTPMAEELRNALAQVLARKIRIILATATSLASTGMAFVIEPLLAAFSRLMIPDEDVSSCLAYIESGTVAYRFDTELKIKPLEDFEALCFNENERRAVGEVLNDTTMRHRRHDVQRKWKPGQVNCYVGGPWQDRRIIADEMNSRFADLAFERLVAQVPSARETIDVAVCTKRRIANDVIARILMRPEEALIIGDSLQPGGNDEALFEGLPGSVAVMVGQLEGCPGVHQAKRLGPLGVLDTIRVLLE